MRTLFGQHIVVKSCASRAILVSDSAYHLTRREVGDAPTLFVAAAMKRWPIMPSLFLARSGMSKSPDSMLLPLYVQSTLYLDGKSFHCQDCLESDLESRFP